MISPTVEVKEGQQTWQDHAMEPLLSPSEVNQEGYDTDRQEDNLESSSNRMNKNEKMEMESLNITHLDNFEMERLEENQAALVSVILGIFCLIYGYAYCISLAGETYETRQERDNNSFYEGVSLMNILGLNFMSFGLHILYSGLLYFIVEVDKLSSNSPNTMNEYNMSNEVHEANDTNDVGFDILDRNSITIECSSSEYTWVSLWRITKGYGMYTLICIILWMPITFVTLSIANAGYGSVYIIVIGSLMFGALMANKLFKGNEAVRLVLVVQLAR